MPTIVLVKAGRLWCYRARIEADLYEERVYAAGVTPSPEAPYTVRTWRCSLDQECNAKSPACRLTQPADLAAVAAAPPEMPNGSAAD
jgi:hypothetical protein